MADQVASSGKLRRGKQQMDWSSQDRGVALIVLVATVAIVLAGWRVPSLGPYTVLAIAMTLLGAFVVTREYGYSIATGITGGVGCAVLAVGSGANDSAASTLLLLLAAGFLSAWILGMFAVPSRRDLWPLVPAVILVVVGASLL